jgi:hypothetical protein
MIIPVLRTLPPFHNRTPTLRSGLLHLGPSGLIHQPPLLPTAFAFCFSLFAVAFDFAIQNLQFEIGPASYLLLSGISGLGRSARV